MNEVMTPGTVDQIIFFLILTAVISMACFVYLSNKMVKIYYKEIAPGASRLLIDFHIFRLILMPNVMPNHQKLRNLCIIFLTTSIVLLILSISLLMIKELYILFKVYQSSPYERH